MILLFISECEENLECHDVTAQTADGTAVTSVTPMLPCHDVESNNETLSKKYSQSEVSGKPKSVIAKLLLLSFVLLCIFCTIVLVNQQETTLKSNKLLQSDDTRSTSHGPIKFLTTDSIVSTSLGRCTSNGSVTKVLVHSYRDLEGQFSKFDKHCHQFSLDITSRAANDWPTISPTLDDMVINGVSIAGEMPVHKIVGILKHTKNLEKLHFDNKLGQLCNINNNSTEFFEEIPKCSTELPKLAYLKMSGFTSCDTLVTMLLACVKMQPQKIDFDGKINDENVQQISELFKSSLRTLTDITITGTFDSQVSVIPSGYYPSHVKQISIEILNRDVSRTYGKVLIDNSFCSSFPLLHKLRLKGVYFNLKDLQLLQTCKAIQELSIGIDVRETDLRKIKRSYFQEQFPVLTSLDVYLAFTLCPSPDILTNFANEFGNIKSLTVCSNCIVSNNRNSKCHRKMLAHVMA